MADRDLSRSIKIYIDGTPAAEGIAPVEQAIAKLEGKLAALNKAEANYQQESEKLKKQLESKHRTLQNYKKKVEETERVLNNLSGATYKELLAVHKQVKEQLQSAIPGTEKYTVAMEQNRRVTEAMVKAQKEMRVEIGCQGTPLGKLADGINKYAGLITTTVAGVTGLTMTIRKCVNDYAQMAEAEAQVMKYTGMTKEQVADLNEEFKRMDTRTSREKLNMLAADAGRLGIEGKEAILEFVDIADKINVALGEDLGEDAVKNIGKLVTMFGEDDRLGLRGAMNATASAVNTVGQKSSAAESYIVDFAARVAGAGNLAGITQTQIIGLSASMDENMLRNETAATAYQKIVMKLFSDTEKFATAAGLDLQEFGKLVREDANEALLVFAEELGKKGGLADLAPIFGDLQTEGAGVSSLLSVMASKAGEIREQQALANQAYQEGASVLQEYAVQNNTVQAGLDKAKKGFLEVSIELGEKLLPLMSHTVSSAGVLVRLLNTLTGFLLEHKGAVLGAAVALGAMVVQKKLIVTWTQLEVAWNNRAITSWKSLRTVMSKNLFGIVLMGVGAYIGKLYDAKSKQDELKESLQGMDKVNAEVSKNFIAEESKIRRLSSIVNNNSIALGERRKALEELKEIIPGYNGMITDEGELTNNNTEAIKEYLVQLEKQIRLKAAQQELEELYKKQRTLQKTEKEQSDTYWDIRQQNTLSGYNRDGFTAKLSRYFGLEKEDDARKALEGTRKELVGVAAMIGEINEEITKTSVAVNKVKETKGNGGGNGGGGNGGGGNDGPTDEERKKRLQALKAQYQEEQAEIMKLFLSGKSEELRTEEQYNARLLQAKREYLDRVLGIAAAGSTEAADAQKQLAEMELQVIKEKSKKLSAERDKELSMEQAAYDTQKRSFKQQLDARQLTRQQYDIFMAAATSNHSEKVLAIEQQYYDKARLMTERGEGNMVAFIEQSRERIAKAAQKSVDDRLAAEQTYLNNLDVIRSMAERADASPQAKENAVYQAKLLELQGIYEASVEYARRTGRDTAAIEAEYNTARENLTKEHNKRVLEMNMSKNDALADQINDPFQQEMMSAYSAIANLQELMENFSNFTEKEFKEKLVQCIGQLVNSVTSGLSSAFNTFKQIEIDNIEARYNAEIEAAAGDAEKIEELEREKAQKKLDVEKKYADVEFAIKASQIIASTAMAVMTCLAQLGPIAGPIMAGVMVATGAIQLAAANAEREKVKSQTLDGGGSSSAGGGARVATGRVPQHARGRYDVIGAEDNRTYRDVPYIGESPTGIVRSPALISENGAELIVNAEDLRRLQQHVNYPLVMQAISESHRGGVVAQHAGGTYREPVDDGLPPSSGAALPPELIIRLTAAIASLEANGVDASVSLTDFEKKQKLRDKSRKIGSKKKP